MVRLSIYNEKGGVGKTTLTVLVASYLAYGRGLRVCVVDFDYPTYHLWQLRESELSILADPRSPLAAWLRENPSEAEPYTVIRAHPGAGGVFSPREVFALERGIDPIRYDILLYDFPGRFTPDEPVSLLAANGGLDFVGIPMDTDVQSRRSALVVADALAGEGVPLVLFWNRVSAPESRGSGVRFRRGAEPFVSRGMDVMDEAVRDVRIISRDSSEMAFVRSTLCFPTRYVNMRSASIIPFLEALKGRIDNVQHTSL